MSDILLSRPDIHPSQSVALPLKPRPIKHVSGGYMISGVAQKMVLLNDQAMFLWAGSLPAARAAIEHLATVSEGGSKKVGLGDELKSSGLSESELRDVTIIYHQILEGRIWVQCHNAESAELGPAKIAYAGSGSFDFVDDTVVRVNSGAIYEPERLAEHWLVRAIHSVVTETVSHRNYDYLYGGWIEVEHSHPQNFRKLPYAIKFWRRNGASLEVAGLPLFFSWYHGHDLMICSIGMVPAANDIKIIRVPDLLGRTKRRFERRRLPWSPEFICHAVITENGSVYVYKESGALTRVRVARTGNFEARFDPKLIEKLIKIDHHEGGQSFYDLSRISDLN